MKVTFLVQSAHKLGGTERSAITQANALAAAGHDVRILSVVKAAEQPAFDIDRRVAVEHLVDLTRPSPLRRGAAPARPSVLVPSGGTSSSRRSPTSVSSAGLRGLDHRRAGHGDAGAAGLRRHRSPPTGSWSCTRSTGPPRSAPRAWSRCSSTRRGPTWSRCSPRAIARVAARRARPGGARDRGDAQRAAPGLRAALAARLQDDRGGRPAGDGEAVHQAGAGLRRGGRPAARVAAADPRPGPPAAAPGARDPQARALGPGRAAGQHHRHAPASGPRPASARSPRAPRGSRSGCRRRWPPASRA